MTQQTALDWLIEQLKQVYDKEGKLPLVYTFELLKQAKQIEKEQIIKAASVVLWKNSSNSTESAEQYYNETYKK